MPVMLEYVPTNPKPLFESEPAFHWSNALVTSIAFHPASVKFTEATVGWFNKLFSYQLRGLEAYWILSNESVRATTLRVNVTPDVR